MERCRCALRALPPVHGCAIIITIQIRITADKRGWKLEGFESRTGFDRVTIDSRRYF
jgi:hypothetical protein